MSYETISVEKICRTCLTHSSDMQSLYFSTEEPPGNSLRLFEMLMCCASVQVIVSDGLPSHVCPQCAHYINRAYSFKQLCERSDRTLRELLGRPLQQQTEQTFLELKPFHASDNLATNSMNEIIIGVTSEFEPPVTDESLTAVEQEAVPLQPPEEILENIQSQNKNHSISNNNEACVEAFKGTELGVLDQHDEDMKFELFGNDAGFNNETDSDTGLQEQKIHVLKGVGGVQTVQENDVTVDKKDNKDETEQRIYPCQKCTLCFTTQTDLKTHKKSLHKRSDRHTCKTCHQDFASASTLCRHMKTHEGVKRHLCNECGKRFSRSDDLTRHLRTHTGEKPFQCNLCGKSFAQSFRLLEHMRAHANEKNFICSVCGKAFSRYTSLAAHNKTHLGLKTHTCSECGKKLCGSGSLAMHLKTHSGLKDHICPFCGKGFTTPSNLIIHKRTHTGERPYVCKVCGKGFPDSSRLTVHSRSHSGEKPYVCNTCGRGCVSSSQLKKHVMRIHTGERPYQCNLCPRAFPSSEDLRVHIKTHTGDRSYVCMYCKKGFYQASTLKVHLRIHTGEKPYTCQICNKSFSQTGPLSTHMKTHR